MTAYSSVQVIVLPKNGDSESVEPPEKWCPPLAQNLGDQKGPPRPGHFGTPDRFNQWVTRIWEPRVHPRKSFSRNDFTRDCLMIDPFSTMRGARRCSRYFRLLFLAFPSLSGEHYGFAANENTIMVNWAFVMATEAGEKMIVPSLDIFGFRKGRVHYRRAAFDRIALTQALIHAYPHRFNANVEANLVARMWLWHVDDRFANAESAVLRRLGKLRPF